MKRTFSWFLIIAIILVGVWFFWVQRTHAPAAVVVEKATPVQPAEKLSPETAATPALMIEVTTPASNMMITSPLTVTGRARGPWYFEASFPIELKDSNGIVIGSTTGQAQGDWMTENWVPFTAVLSYPAQPVGSVGSLVLRKDNPSGEPANDASVSIPVQF